MNTMAELRETLRASIRVHDQDMDDPTVSDPIRIYIEGRRDAEYDILKRITSNVRKEQMSS